MNNLIDDNDGRTEHLEEVRQNFDANGKYVQNAAVFGYTINLPRTKRFGSMIYTKQKAMIKQIFVKALGKVSRCKQCTPFRYLNIFETCKDGVPHLHGVLQTCCENMKEHSIAGFMNDLHKMIHVQANDVLKIKKQFQNSYNDEYDRIKSPLFHMQYMHDENEYIRWQQYISKTFET